MNFFKIGLTFIKKNPEILYSLALIILIPSALYFNTQLSAKSFQKEMDFALRNQTFITEEVFGALITDLIAKPELLQEKIENIIKETPEDIAGIRVEIKTDEGFKTIASYPPAEEEIIETENPATEDNLKRWTEDHRTIAWNLAKGESLSFITLDEQGTRFWTVVKNIYDSSNKKAGLVTMGMSLKKADERIAEAHKRSFVFMIIAALFSLFLIVNHTRLFEYASLYRKAQELDKMKDEFISMTAHELRTPITAIRGYAEILKGEIGPSLNAAQSEHISRVIISTERLNDLINDILDVSRIEQGRLTIEPQEISPPKIIKEVVDELKVKADEKGLQLTFQPKEEPYSISIDPQRLKQILINIIGNSIKYTQKGKIEAETIADEIKKKYSIAIKDTGLGMSAEAQKRLFEKFYRVKTKETAEVSGTGLGLWITKALTEKMGGEIFLESMEGVGSKFTIVFPLLKKQAQPETPQSQSQPQQTPPQPK